MSTPLSVTVTELKDTFVVVTDAEGTRWKLPLSAVLGKPVVGQPLFIIAATTQADASNTHPLAQAMVEHLLESPS